MLMQALKSLTTSAKNITGNVRAFEGLRYRFVTVLILANFILTACSTSAIKSSNVPIQEKNETVSQTQTNDSPRITDPTATAENNSETLKATWQRFTADGRYRLAQKEDMRFSEATRGYIPYVYIWGDLAYKKRVGNEHLAAIVVDTTRKDENRFGLVIFSPPEGSRGYKIHWLYHDRDLSKTSVSRASGSMFVTEHLDDGSLNTCAVHWYRSRNQFECKIPNVIRLS